MDAQEHLRDAPNSRVSAGFSVLMDRPFAVHLIPTIHWPTKGQVKAVLIEVNRGLYMDEETTTNAEFFGSVRNVVSEMLRGVALWTADRDKRNRYEQHFQFGSRGGRTRNVSSSQFG